MKKRYFAAILLAACSWTPTVHAEEVTTNQVVIAAIQTGQEGAAGNDFLVLHNNSDKAVDVTGWRVQYRAAGSSGTAGWTTKRTLACLEPAGCSVVLPARTNIVVGTYSPGIPVQPMASGFSDPGGQIRLMRPLTGTQFVAVDMVGYGTAVEAEGNSSAPAPLPGRAILRSITNDYLEDTNNNGADFMVGCYEPSLTSVPLAVSCDPPAEAEDEEIEAPVPQTTQPQEPPVSTIPTQAAYAPLVITELLPDPASPATDSADEFIELYNPGSEPVNLQGYSLQAGTDFKDQYTFGSLIVPAGGYVAVFAAATHIGLTNSGTAVQLLDPAGTPVDTVASYGQAKTGSAWGKDPAGGWRWTIPTPNVQNSFSTAAPALMSAAAAIKKATTPTIKKTVVPKAKATKAPTATVAKVAAKTPPSNTPSNPTAQESSPIPYMILGVIGVGVVGYALYEYRQDVARLFRKIKHVVMGRKAATAEPTLQTD